MNDESRQNSASSIQRVVRDVIDLCELQLELLSIDSQVARRKLLQAIILGSVALAFGGSALTVAIGGGGVLLAELTELSTGVSLLIVAGACFILVAILLGLALSAIRVAGAVMSETKSEFSENLRWLKATLVSPNSSARNQLRRDSFSTDRQAPRSGREYQQNYPRRDRA